MQNLRPSPNRLPIPGGGCCVVHKLWYDIVDNLLKYWFFVISRSIRFIFCCRVWLVFTINP